jgi:hypothetical protein
MTVLAGHLRELRASGLSDETIRLASLYSAPERQTRDLLGYGAGAGLVIPYPNLSGGASVYARVKLDASPDGKRYRSPAKQGNRLYVPALIGPDVLKDPRVTLWLTEGEKKALKACQEGLACVALPGVWSWKTRRPGEKQSAPIGDLDYVVWRDRQVLIVFDSDLAQNASVRDAERALAQELGRRGARVLAVRLPGGPGGSKVGLDDYLLSHTVEALCAIEPQAITNPDVRQAPQPIDVVDLLRREFPETPAVIGGGILPRQGFGVFGGAPKLGKSSLLLNAAICRATGQPWLGFPTTPGRTLYLQAEIPERELKNRLALMSQALEAPIPEKRLITLTYRGLRLDRTEGLQACRRYLEQTRADWLILDPLARFFAGDENSSREVGRLIASLDALIQDLGVAINLVHHTAKPNVLDPREGGHRLRGSSALFAAADSVLLLDRDEDAFRLSFELRHGKEPDPLRMTRTERLWFVPAGPPEDVLAVVAIVRHMALKWAALINAVKADLKVAQATAERMVKRAVKGRFIRKDTDGLYTINPHTITNPQSGSDGSV